MVSRLLYVIFILVFSFLACADWKQSTISDKGLLRKLCGGDGEYNVSEDEFALANLYKNKSVKFIACHSKDEKPDYLTKEYILKYDLGTKTETIHMDAEMMTWGADDEDREDVINVNLYWPSNKLFRRKIKEFQIDCTGKCKIKEECTIERLKNDIEFNLLIKKIEAMTKTEKMRIHFIVDGNQSNSVLLDELFAEALTGNKKARTLIDKMETGIGGNAVASEIIGTYQLFLTDFKSKGCHWGK